MCGGNQSLRIESIFLETTSFDRILEFVSFLVVSSFFLVFFWSLAGSTEISGNCVKRLARGWRRSLVAEGHAPDTPLASISGLPSSLVATDLCLS